MTYLAEKAGEEIAIRPVMPHFDKMAAGGPIEPLRYNTPTWCPFDWNLPALDFKLLNRTSVPFLLAEAIFEVEESRLDPRPVIVIKEDILQSFAGTIWLVNESATSLEDVLVRFELLPGVVPAPSNFPDTYPFEESVGPLQDQTKIQVYRAFGECGVNIEELSTLTNIVDSDSETVKLKHEGGTEIVMTWDEREKAIKQTLGPFREEVGTVIGEISFRESSTDQKYIVRFRAVVYIFNANRKGVPRPPSAVYHVELETSGTNYQKHLPDFSHEIKAGEADRFLIKLQIKQPSSHRFRVAFRNVDGQAIRSPWIRLQCFVPRTRRGLTQPGQALSSHAAF